MVNAPYPVLLEWLGKTSVGISTMVDEHFGINVVEFMVRHFLVFRSPFRLNFLPPSSFLPSFLIFHQAAGLVPLSHASAGPLLDIIVPFESQPTGFHALTPSDFAARLVEIFELPAEDRKAMRLRARKSVAVRFGQGAFEEGWRRAFSQLQLIRTNALGERAQAERESKRDRM